MSRVHVFLFSIAFAAGCGGGHSSTTNKELSARDLYETIQKMPKAQIIDVRTPEEFQKGHVEGAMNLNIKGAEFDQQLGTLDKSKPVFVYCLSGVRSGAAVERMLAEGFREVYHMPGGIVEWRASDLPEVGGRADASGMSLAQYEGLLHSDKLVLVDFYADWCAPCKKMKPFLEEIAVELRDKVVLVRVDADANPELCKELKVAALPTLKLYRRGSVVWDHVGYIDEEGVREQVSNAQEPHI